MKYVRSVLRSKLKSACCAASLGAALLSFLLASLLLAQDVPAKNDKPVPLDVLVIAPHPDDEVIGCAGLMLQALEQKQRVAVVVITSGDGYPALAAAVAKKNREQLTADDFLRAGGLRQQHSMRALERIGVPREELMFLGYPDSGLEKLYTLDGKETFEQAFTKKKETYGVSMPDYHSSVHGRPAPYLKANVVSDIAEIVRSRQPKEIYVTHAADTHGDHRAAFWFVRDAIQSADYHGDFYTYVVHGAPPAEPPSRRLALNPTQVNAKRAALLDHQAGTSPVHDRLAEEYTKPEELFWKVGDEPSTPATAAIDRPEKLTATIGDVLIRIDGPKLWTLSGVDFQNSTIAVQESAYGSVLNITGVGLLGTAHFLDVPGKPGEVEKEQVSRVEFFLNERPVTGITPTMKLSGSSLRMHRESKIRAVRLNSNVTLRDGVLIESVRMQTTEAVDLKLAYPLMYAWSPEMSAYLFGNDSGVQKRGTFLGATAKAGEGLERTSTWMAVYNAKDQKGAALYVTRRPASQEVWLQFTDAPGVYRKVRLMSFSDKTMPAGFDGTFEVAVGFFTATDNDWETLAWNKVRELQSLAAR